MLKEGMGTAESKQTCQTEGETENHGAEKGKFKENCKEEAEYC
jgi:hypothetical protein